MTGFSISIVSGAVLGLLGLLLTILLGVWVYRDAKSKGKNGVLWTLAVIFVPLYIGLIVYLVARMDDKKVRCAKCNRLVSISNQYCSYCGEKLENQGDALTHDANGQSFLRSQKRVLIGYFITLAAIVIVSIVMVVSMIVGSVQLVGDAVEWISEAGKMNWSKEIEESLGDIDVIFDEDEVHVSATSNQVLVTDKEGNVLLKVDGDTKSVDVNIKKINELLEKYDVEYTAPIDEEAMEEYIESEIEKALSGQDATKTTETDPNNPFSTETN